MSRHYLSAVLLSAATALAGSAHAGVITFTDNTNFYSLATVAETVTGTGEGVGATAVFGNAIKEGGSGLYFGGGLGLGSGGIGYTWTMTIDQTVSWTATTLTYAGSNLGFNVSGAGLSVTDLLQGAGTGSHTFATPLVFLANQTYTFTSNNLCLVTHCGAVLFGEWQLGAVDAVAATVPEPTTLGLLGLGLAGLGFARRSRVS